MRAYFINNMYLSSIQQGIQALHAIVELSIKYGTAQDSLESTMYVDWAVNHKVVCLLNGGYSSNLHSLREMLETSSLTIPWAPFYEGTDALDGALTSIALILPEHLYGSLGEQLNKEGLLSKESQQLYSFISDLSLAR